MTLTTRIELRLASYGFNRSLLLRVMIRFGHTKLRSLRAEAVAGRGPRGFVLRQTMNALERGVLRVPQGHGPVSRGQHEVAGRRR